MIDNNLIDYNKQKWQMEIPDFNYKTPIQMPIKPELDDFHTVKESESLSEQENVFQPLTYERNFKSIIEDSILKKTMNISWQERFFCLTTHRLIYYKSSSCFNLASLSIYSLLLEVREEQKILKLLVHVNPDQKSQPIEVKQLLILNFQRIPKRFSLWKKQFQKVIQYYSTKFCKQLSAPSISIQNIIEPQLKINGDNFWNKIYLSVQQLHKFSGQLDILFFKSKKPMAAFHRLLMRSNFDHVGLLLKDPQNRLLVLEAIQTRGVWVNDWQQMLPVFKEHYEQIAYKKLIFPNNHKLDIKKLQCYLDSIIGKKYELSISKLIIGENQSTSQDLQNENKKQKGKKQKLDENKIAVGGNKQKTYFCSELIADIYIKLGVLKGKKNQFWPRDFQNDVKLQNNVNLGPLMYLAF